MEVHLCNDADRDRWPQRHRCQCALPSAAIQYAGAMPTSPLQPGESTDPVVVTAPPELRGHGAVMATLSYRPLDGGEVQQLVGYASTEDYAVAEVHQALDAALGRVQTTAPDTPAVRKFIDAASHMRDLRDALGALEAAEAASDQTVAKKLRVYAVVAYGRTYGSHARSDLAKFVDLSPDDASLTVRLNTTRNKFAAHSENSMTVTHAMLDLQRHPDGTTTVEQVRGMTMSTAMPLEFLAEFAAMLERLIEQLTTSLRTMQAFVSRSLTDAQITEAFENPKPLQLVAAPVSEWEPSGRRPAYPASHLTRVLLTDHADVEVSITP